MNSGFSDPHDCQGASWSPQRLMMWKLLKHPNSEKDQPVETRHPATPSYTQLHQATCLKKTFPSHAAESSACGTPIPWPCQSTVGIALKLLAGPHGRKELQHREGNDGTYHGDSNRIYIIKLWIYRIWWWWSSSWWWWWWLYIYITCHGTQLEVTAGKSPAAPKHHHRNDRWMKLKFHEDL